MIIGIGLWSAAYTKLLANNEVTTDVNKDIYCCDACCNNLSFTNYFYRKKLKEIFFVSKILEIVF